MISANINERVDSGSNEFLTFQLGNEAFCLGILSVQEIRGYDAITTISNTPDYIKGVVNLRGKIVPIYDLRIKLNLETSYDDSTVVIILNLEGLDVGVVVDSVSDVIALQNSQIEDLPSMVSNVNTEFITGVATIDTQMMMLLDIEKLIVKDNLNLLTEQSLQ